MRGSSASTMAAGWVHAVQCVTHTPISSRHSSMQQVLYGAVDVATVCVTNTQLSSKTQMATHERMGRTIGSLTGRAMRSRDWPTLARGYGGHAGQWAPCDGTTADVARASAA